MCGIAGVWHFGGFSEARLRQSVAGMTDAIVYRGPDGDGAWVDAQNGIALGHRRLAIVDLSPTGVQPMVSADGRIVISYNGELYNRHEMAAELATTFRGTSDTEVLVEAVARYGIDGALQRANGMFAFAAFDRSTRTLHLARDRLGIKPLYWTQQNGMFAFASELKALRVLKEADFSIDLQSVSAFLRHACVPAPRTIYRNVAKLSPGERIEVTEFGLNVHCYWDVHGVAREKQRSLKARSDEAVIEELEALLADAVRRQMISDVPLGAFLSGGIDSSLVVALMRATGNPVKTFSIGFQEQAYNEADYASAVAKHLKTEHTDFIFSPAEAQAIIPQLPSIYDEPFADSSQLPTYLVSRLARSQVTVALSGDGGDEGFGGYVRHQGISRLWNAMGFVPQGVRGAAADAIELLSPAAWDAVFAIAPRRIKPSHFGDKIIKGAGLLRSAGPLDMYRRLISQWSDPAQLLAGTEEPAGWADLFSGQVSEFDTLSQLRLLDMMSYLPDDILTKVDRASMAVSLEVRVPLLDHRIVEFAWGLPSEQLVRNGKGKWPLRQVLGRYVPDKLVDRPKTGFGIPVGDWMRGPLRGWVEDMLSPGMLARVGLFNNKLVRDRLDEHFSGRRNWQYALWTLLQFQSWWCEQN